MDDAPFLECGRNVTAAGDNGLQEVMEHSVAIKVVPREDVLECNGMFFV